MWTGEQSRPRFVKLCLREYDSCCLGGYRGNSRREAEFLVGHMVLTLSSVI